METIGKFTLADVLVFAATILASLGIGVFFAIWDRLRNKDSPDDYFLAGRKGRAIPVGLSFIVTFMSSILVVGFPAESYLYGAVFGFFGVGTALAQVFAAFFVVPVVHPLQLTTIYEYLALRFGNNVLRYLTLTLGLLYGVFYMGTVTYGTCVVLEVVIGIPYWGSILIYSVVTSLYTSIGGIKAVIWTDAFQFVIMVAGFVAVIFKATADTGGWSAMVNLAGERLDYGQWNLDPRTRLTIWNTIFGTFTMLLSSTLMQPGIQRIYSTPDTQTARRMLLFASPFFIILCGAASFEGGVLFAYFKSKGCDVVAGNVVENVNQVVPFAVMDIFQTIPGLPGLFVAALSCAALSTLSSFLSSLSAIVYEDIFKVKHPDFAAHAATNVARLLTFAFGAVAMGATFLISVLPGTILSLFQGLVGCLDGPTCAIFILAAASRRTTTKGILAGTVCGMVLAFWINVGKLFADLPPDPTLPSGPTDGCDAYIGRNSSLSERFLTTSSSSLISNSPMGTNSTTPHYTEEPELSPLDQLYSISFMLISLTGFLTTIIVGTVVSLFTKPMVNVDERCIFSFRKHIVEELFVSQCERDTVSLAPEEVPMVHVHVGSNENGNVK